MVSNLETKSFFKDCVKLIKVKKWDYLNEIRSGADYIRLSKEYENLDNLIYLAEDKIDEIQTMKNLIQEAKKSFKTPPDYGLLKFYLLVKHTRDVNHFLQIYGNEVLQDITGRE